MGRRSRSKIHQRNELDLGWYDYGARMYDGSIIRWNGVDVLAGKYASTTTYSYVLGNPLKFFDPNGMSVSSARNPNSGRNPNIEKKEEYEKDKYLDAENGDLLGEDGSDSDNIRLIKKGDFENIKKQFGNQTNSEEATQALQAKSNLVDIEEDKINSQLWTAHVKTSNIYLEHTVYLLLDLKNARIYAVPGTTGDHKSAPMPTGSRTRYFSSYYDSDLRTRIIALIHGHPNAGPLARINMPGVSKADVNGARDRNIPVYALNSFGRVPLDKNLNPFQSTEIYFASPNENIFPNIPLAGTLYYNPYPVGRLHLRFGSGSFKITQHAIQFLKR